jgi:hypothetical protein
MTDHQRRPVFGRPPVDGTDEELEEWAREFVDEIHQPPRGDASEDELGDAGPLLDPYGGPQDDCGDLYPTEDMIDQAEWTGSTFAGDEELNDEDDAD